VDFTIAFMIVAGLTVAICLWPPAPTRLSTVIIVFTAGIVLIVTVLALAVVLLAAAIIAITLASGTAVLVASGLPIPPALKSLFERGKEYLPAKSPYEV
jgi:hypothetical protein